MRHALIFGHKGIVGLPLCKQLLLEGCWRITGISRSKSDQVPPEVVQVDCDIGKADETKSKLASLVNTVTHIFYVTWVQTDTEDDMVKKNLDMFINAISPFVNSPHLQHVYLQTGTKFYGVHLGPQGGMRTPARETDPRLDIPNFYYSLEDKLKEFNQGKKWRYGIGRPSTIFGVGVSSQMNFASSVAVYASILKRLGMPLIFPGNESHFHQAREASDSLQIVRFARWLGDNPHTHGEAFYIHSCDWFRFEQMWPKIAAYFGMEWCFAPTYPFDIETFMGQPKMKTAWKELIKEHGLRDIPLEKIATWWFMQFTIQRDWPEFTMLKKVMSYGFTPVQDTEQLFYDTFD